MGESLAIGGALEGRAANTPHAPGEATVPSSPASTYAKPKGGAIGKGSSLPTSPPPSGGKGADTPKFRALTQESAIFLQRSHSLRAAGY